MARSRYENTPIIDLTQFTTQDAYNDIKRDIDNGLIESIRYMVKPRDRLDTIASQFYGDGRYWWIVALSNDIGWSLQIPGGTLLRIPLSIDTITDRL